MDLLSLLAGALLVGIGLAAGIFLGRRSRVANDGEGTAKAQAEAILEAAVDGIVTIDERGLIQNMNRAAERIFGYRAGEVKGKNVSMLMPEPYRSGHDGYLQNYLRTGRARIIGIGREVVGLRKDGSTFPMDLAVGESIIGGRRIFAGIVRDITERKRTENALRQSEARFRLLVDGVSDYAITVLDEDGRIVSWNSGAERQHGWTAEEVIGKSFETFFEADEQASGTPSEIIAQVTRKGRVETEGWRVRKDGSRFWAHCILSALQGDGDQPLTGFVRIARDMTERKTQEEALRRAKDDAERANLAKSKFLAAASHDLRQPVQALFFFVSALGRRLSGQDNQALLSDLERSLEALNILLDSLLDISKLDAGVIKAQPADFSVHALLERMDSEYGPIARDKRLDLRVVPSSATVRSDPALLARVVQNLVNNAIRYTEQGRILVGCRRHGRHLRIEVWDTGIGIADDRLHEIFDEFTQIGNSERDRSQGLGLGLAIVKRLSNLMGHKVQVRSLPGRGSVFSVELPLGKAPRLRSRPKPMPLALSGDRRLVVLIDDEMMVLRGLAMLLEQWGFDVLSAGSEQEAIAQLAERTRTPDAIVADYRLRDGMTGSHAINAIRTLFGEPIPSIIITGDTAPERLREAESSGFAILHKPVQPPILQDLLSRSIGPTLH